MKLLTDEEIAEICCSIAQSTSCDIAYARAIEAAILKKIGKPLLYWHAYPDGRKQVHFGIDNDAAFVTPLYQLPRG